MTENKPTAPLREMSASMQFRDYVAIAQRRKWWVIGTALAVFVGTLVVALRLPTLYTASTVILVDAQKVPDTYIPSTVSTSIADRLSTIQQQVMSETRLRKLIDSMKLYPELSARLSPQDLVRHMQKSIKVEIVSPGGRQLSAFQITFQDRRPVVAAQVANQLASMFIDENLKVREQQSYGTADFLQSELEKTKKELDDKDSQLSDIKRKNVMDLPESKQYHLQALEELRMQLRSSQDRIDHAQQEKVYLQSLLSTTAPTVDTDKEDGASYQAQIGKLETALSQLRSRYGPDHPDVRKAQAEIDKLKAQAAEDSKNRVPATTTTAGADHPPSVHKPRNPVIESQIAKLKDDIDKENSIQADLQPQIQFHMSKLQNLPIFEQQMANVMRDYDTLRAYYTSLLDKKLGADTSSALESRQKGERFVILDPATTPDTPSAPNRLLLILAGIAAGFLGGIGIAMVLEFADESIRTEKELKRLTAVTVLGAVPQMSTAQEKGVQTLRIAASIIAAVAVSGSLGWLIAFVSSRAV